MNLTKNSGGRDTAINMRLNDLNMRMHMVKSLGLKKIPPINVNAIDESSGIIAKTVHLKNFNFEELLYYTRHDYSRFVKIIVSCIQTIFHIE